MDPDNSRVRAALGWLELIPDEMIPTSFICVCFSHLGENSIELID